MRAGYVHEAGMACDGGGLQNISYCRMNSQTKGGRNGIFGLDQLWHGCQRLLWHTLTDTHTSHHSQMGSKGSSVPRVQVL